MSVGNWATLFCYSCFLFPALAVPLSLSTFHCMPGHPFAKGVWRYVAAAAAMAAAPAAAENAAHGFTCV